MYTNLAFTATTSTTITFTKNGDEYNDDGNDNDEDDDIERYSSRILQSNYCKANCLKQVRS